MDRHEYTQLRGLPVTRPSRTASDLLADHEDPEAVAFVVADAIRAAHDYLAIFADSLAPYGARFGFRRGDGLALLRWRVDLVGDPDTGEWIAEARQHLVQGGGNESGGATPGDCRPVGAWPLDSSW